VHIASILLIGDVPVLALSRATWDVHINSTARKSGIVDRIFSALKKVPYKGKRILVNDTTHAEFCLWFKDFVKKTPTKTKLNSKLRHALSNKPGIQSLHIPQSIITSDVRILTAVSPRFAPWLQFEFTNPATGFGLCRHFGAGDFAAPYQVKATYRTSFVKATARVKERTVVEVSYLKVNSELHIAFPDAEQEGSPSFFSPQDQAVAKQRALLGIRKFKDHAGVQSFDTAGKAADQDDRARRQTKTADQDRARRQTPLYTGAWLDNLGHQSSVALRFAVSKFSCMCARARSALCITDFVI